jgi:hypothetical protein
LLTAINISVRFRVLVRATCYELEVSGFESQLRHDFSYASRSVPRPNRRTVLQWVPCYNGYRATVVTVLQWVLCYNGYRATMGTVLQWVLCYNGYRATVGTVLQWVPCFFTWVKRKGRGVDHPSPYCVQVKESVELYLHRSLSVSSWYVTNRTDLYIEYQSDLLCKTFTRNSVLFVTKRTANDTSWYKCQI